MSNDPKATSEYAPLTWSEEGSIFGCDDLAMFSGDSIGLMKQILSFKKYQEPYIYKRKDTPPVSCTRYVIESMSPALNSLYKKVKEKAKADGVNRIVNINKVDLFGPEGTPAFVDRDTNNNIVIAFLPELINEWIYAHELIHYLNPEVKQDLEPNLKTSHPKLNTEILNEIAKRLFGVIVDHFINRLVFQAGIDIDIFIEFQVKVTELHPRNPLERTYFAQNLLSTLLMERYISNRDTYYQKFMRAKRTIEDKYPGLISVLSKFVHIVNSVENFEFKDIQDLYRATLSQNEIISGLYQFAVNAGDTEFRFTFS